MTRALDVWRDGRIVGQLMQNRHGALGFAYGSDWLRSADAPALSVSLPKREEPYSRRECRPFFAGLLPEESQRDAVARVLGVSRANEFALLVYDLLATVVYPELSPALAMKIGRRSTLEEMDIGGWARFAAPAELGLPFVRRRVAEIGAGVRTQAGEVAGGLMRPGLDAQTLPGLAGTVAGRAQRCASTARRRSE